MAHIYSKGWFIQQLKAVGINKYNNYKLEKYKTHVLAKLYAEHVENKEK